MNDSNEIKNLYRTYWDYMIVKNADGLREIMTEDYHLMHMTGVKQSRETFLTGLMDGTFNYYSAVHDDIEVSVNENTATMTGKSRVMAAVYGGGKHRWRLRGDFTIRKEDGIWKLASSRASIY